MSSYSINTPTANSSISTMRPPCYSFLEEIAILGVIYRSLLRREYTQGSDTERNLHQVIAKNDTALGVFYGIA